MDSHECLHPKLLIRLEVESDQFKAQIAEIRKVLGPNGQHTLRALERRVHKLELIGALLIAVSGVIGAALGPRLAALFGG